jgi:hypothetical protein
MDAALRCRRFGWWSLLVWLSLGLALEAMHGFKLGWYLDVGNDARRLLLRLAHAHGGLLALVVLAAAALPVPAAAASTYARGTRLLRWAAVLMPLGFLAGGLVPLGGDPGPGIVLVPIGGVLLLVGVLTMARLSTRAERP